MYTHVVIILLLLSCIIISVISKTVEYYHLLDNTGRFRLFHDEQDESAIAIGVLLHENMNEPEIRYCCSFINKYFLFHFCNIFAWVKSFTMVFTANQLQEPVEKEKLLFSLCSAGGDRF